MSARRYSHVVQKKLTEQIEVATDPLVIAELANALAKFMPRPQPKKKRGRPPLPREGERKQPSLDELVAAVEKKRKGKELTAEEVKALNSGSAEVA